MLDKPRIKLIVKLVVSVLILSYIFWRVPFDNVLNSIRAADLKLILISLAIIALIDSLTAVHTKILTDKQAMDLGVIQILKINLITVFYSLFLPGTISAGVVKWYKFSKPQGKKTEAFAVILFNRYYDTIILCGLGIVLCFLDPIARQNVYTVSAMMVIGIGLGVCGVIVHAPWVVACLQDRMLQMPWIATSIRLVMTKLVEVVKQFHGLTKIDFFNITAVIVTKHLFGIVLFALFGFALDMDLSFFTLGWIRTSILMVMMLPISVSGLGVREGGLIVMLKMYGIAPHQALAFSFLLLGRSIITGLVGGLLEARSMIKGRQI